MIFLLCILSLLLAVTVKAAFVNSSVITAADNSSFYVLAYAWTPEYCYNASRPGCLNHPKPYWGKYFTLHGLWPQPFVGDYTQYCTDEPFDPKVPLEIGWNTMTTYWPDVDYLETDSNYDQFWVHEWTKHGTCSGLSQYDYFSLTIDLYLKFPTPVMMTKAVGSTISATAMRDVMGGEDRVALTCTDEKYIDGVYTCWSQSNGVPQSQIDCPADVLAEDTCTVEELYVTSL